MPEQPISAEGETDLSLEIAHILFIDTVGYSKLPVSEQREFQELLNRVVRGTSRFRAAEAAGKLIRLPTGDGMALVFAESIEAPLTCALEISESLRAYPKLPVRMGIHSGSVSRVMDVNDRVNIAGAGVNIAQRVMSCGDAGHILMSKHVADDLAEYPQWRPFLHNLGECEMKHGQKVNIVSFYSDKAGNSEIPRRLHQIKQDRMVGRKLRLRRRLIGTAVLFVAVASVAVFFFRRSPIPSPVVPEKSIAVLPFENRSEDKANAYFADAIQDEILTRLAKIADLKVISRTSTQHYKSTPENLRQIGKELGVAHIVEGSVQRSGEQVRVNVQLIKAANDYHLWADTFDRKLTDILSVETEVAKTIADQLRAKLTGREEQNITARPTENSEAYDAYLRGLAYTLKAGGVTPANSLGAQKYLRDAVRLDPKFALGWALLSLVDSRGYVTAVLQPTIELRDEARNAAETALQLQPGLGDALYAMGYYHYACEKDYDTAVRYFEQARQLLPNNSRIPESLAYVARRRGQWDQSDAYFNEAERLDPRDVNLLRQYAASYVAQRRFSEAEKKLDEVLNITPGEVDTIAQKAGLFQAKGDLSAAAALLNPLRPGPDRPTPLQAQAYQAILERRSADIIPRLKEVLSRADPAMGYLNGELKFFLGWAQSVAGDHSGAEETWRQARNDLEVLLPDQPENYSLIGYLALANMSLHDKSAALALADRAMKALPVERDSLLGPLPVDIYARVAANVGEREQAIATVERLLTTSYAGPFPDNVPLTPAVLRLDPMFDPLRKDPRFERLINR